MGYTNALGAEFRAVEDRTREGHVTVAEAMDRRTAGFYPGA